MFIRTYGGKIPDRVYMDANDVHVSAYILYVNEDSVACFDAAGTRPVTKQRLANLFVKGFLISDSGNLYAPVSIDTGDSEVTVSYVMAESGAPVLATVSGQDPEEAEEAEEEEEDAAPLLATLSLGTTVLTPTFSDEVLEYTTTTTEESDLLTFTVLPVDAKVVVKHNTTVVENLAAPIVWGDAPNVITITLGEGETVVVYTITVTVGD